MKHNAKIGKIISVICCFAAVLELTGCAVGKSSSLPPAGTNESRKDNPASTESGIISLSEAENIALAHAEVGAFEVKFIKTELDYENGRAEYELEFVSDTYKYEYDISALDGAILKFSRETVMAGQGTKPDATEPEAPTAVPPALPEPTAEPTLPEPTAAPALPEPQPTGEVTLDEAKRIALDYAGLTEADVRFTKAELDYDDGIKEYEIEFYFGKKEYEFKIDVSSGKILEVEIDR